MYMQGCFLQLATECVNGEVTIELKGMAEGFLEEAERYAAHQCRGKHQELPNQKNYRTESG